MDMEHCQQPLLKAYMQEGRPVSFINNELTVVYDEESAAMHISELKKEKQLIETCLRRVSGNNKITFKINEEEGVLSPLDVSHLNSKDLAAVKERAENNPFVQDVMNLFEGILSFSSLPKNSLISIDGELMGLTPLENINLEQGRYTVEVGIPGYEKIPLLFLSRHYAVCVNNKYRLCCK